MSQKLPIRLRTTRSGKANVSVHECRVYRFDCNHARDRKLVVFLQEVAVAQKPAFEDIFPWESSCDKNTVMFVSLSMPVNVDISISKLKTTPPTVCGWLVATYSGHPEDGAFVSKLSTRAATDKTFGGVGKQLLQAVEGIGADFIYLYPVDSAVGFYEKAGYKHLVPNVKHMFKIVAKTDKKVVLPNVQSFATSLDEVGEFLKEAADYLDKEDYKRLVVRIGKERKEAYTAMAIFEEDRDSLREWLDGNAGGHLKPRRRVGGYEQRRGHEGDLSARARASAHRGRAAGA